MVSLALGALAGWIAGKIMGSKSSFLRNMIIGVLGGVVGGWLGGLIGIGGGWVMSIVLAVVGSCLLIWLAKLILK